MGVPNSRVSIRSLVSLKRSPKTDLAHFRRTNSSSRPPIQLVSRQLYTNPLQSGVAFDPSHSALPLAPPSPELQPNGQAQPSSSSSSQHPHQQRPHRDSAQPQTSSSSPSSSSLIISNSTKPESQDHHLQNPSTRSIGSSLIHSQFNPFNFYSHPINPSPLQLGSHSRLLLPKKTFFVFRNGASGIPKTAHGTTSHPQNSGRRAGAARSATTAGGTGQAKITHLSSATGHSAAPDQSDYRSVQVGEDSYFLRSDSLGVADGVGGWSGKPGANAGLFSSKLMHHCSVELSRYEDINDIKFLSYNQADPVDILQYAYDRSIHESKNEGILGSSTALLAVLRNDELRIANIGDCCCSIIRGTDYIFRSDEQQHSFNYPVQIGTNSKSTPLNDAQRYKIKVQKDDIVILSSDGLADNLFDEDILEEVLKYTSSNLTGATDEPSNRNFLPEVVSESLCLKAKTVIEDQHAVTSPFAQRAHEEGIQYLGGKNDDISVLVAIIGDQNDSDR